MVLGGFRSFHVLVPTDQYDQQFTNISADTSVKTPYKRHDSHNFQHNLYGYY